MSSSASPPQPPAPQGAPNSLGRLRAEVLLVLGLSLGASAVYSIVNIIDDSTKKQSIASQTTTLNGRLNDRATFDLIYQFLGVFFALVPVALVIFLLWNSARPHLSRLGIDFSRGGRDALSGIALALIIGIPGIGVYLGGRALGLSVTVHASALDTYWWTVPILILSAFRAGATEEVIVIGYLFARLRDLGWGRWQIIVSTSLLRGSYHLYQGLPAFVGNFLMGMLFGWLYDRYSRVVPLVIAHTLIDSAIFVGYPYAAATFPQIFG